MVADRGRGSHEPGRRRHMDGTILMNKSHAVDFENRRSSCGGPYDHISPDRVPSRCPGHDHALPRWREPARAADGSIAGGGAEYQAQCHATLLRANPGFGCVRPAFAKASVDPDGGTARADSAAGHAKLSGAEPRGALDRSQVGRRRSERGCDGSPLSWTGVLERAKHMRLAATDEGPVEDVVQGAHRKRVGQRGRRCFARVVHANQHQLGARFRHDRHIVGDLGGRAGRTRGGAGVRDDLGDDDRRCVMSNLKLSAGDRARVDGIPSHGDRGFGTESELRLRVGRRTDGRAAAHEQDRQRNVAFPGAEGPQTPTDGRKQCWWEIIGWSSGERGSPASTGQLCEADSGGGHDQPSQATDERGEHGVLAVLHHRNGRHDRRRWCLLRRAASAAGCGGRTTAGDLLHPNGERVEQAHTVDVEGGSPGCRLGLKGHLSPGRIGLRRPERLQASPPR